MRFKHIDDIKKFILMLKKECNEESQWYEELLWFSSNKYTTSSEYLGELILFVDKLIQEANMDKYKLDLIELTADLKSFFE